MKIYEKRGNRQLYLGIIIFQEFLTIYWFSFCCSTTKLVEYAKVEKILQNEISDPECLIYRLFRVKNEHPCRNPEKPQKCRVHNPTASVKRPNKESQQNVERGSQVHAYL